MSIIWINEGYFISDNHEHLDIETLFSYLHNESYWAQGIPRDVVTRSIKNSLCFGVFKGNPSDGPAKQIGFARVVTDKATFAWLADVFILPEHRGQGLSKWLVQTILEHPELQGLRRFMLATADAHGLYAQYGFKPIDTPERFMAIAPGRAIYNKSPESK